MTGKYKSGIKVDTKAPPISKVQIAAVFAAQINNSLVAHAMSLQDLDAQSEIPKELYNPIQDFFAKVIESSDQYKRSLKQINTTHLKKTQALISHVQNFETLMTLTLSKSTADEGKLLPVIRQLISDVHHFVEQQGRTHNSYVPGMSPNTRPVNWSLREAVCSHILEYQSIVGAGKYPNLNAAQLRARSNGHQLSDRTYREIKAMHKDGTLFHYIQPKYGSK